MFIERSAGRIRLVRTAFVLAGLLPCVGLAAWAAWRHSAAHQEVVRRECERAIGLPLDVGGIEHPRPNCIRLRACTVRSPGGVVLATLPVIEVERSAAEVRLRLPRLECTAETARTLAAVAGDWLRGQVPESRACIVDVDDFRWADGSAPRSGVGRPDSPADPLHVECVSAGGTRAIRVRRDPRSPDEVRVRSTFVPGMAGVRLEVSGSTAAPLPAVAVAALVGTALGDCLAALGRDATLRGAVEAACEGGRWSGFARGRVERVDLAGCAAGSHHALAGEATLSVPLLEWRAGRLTRCRLECVAGRGMIGQSLLDAVVTSLGCRAGPAYRSLAGEPARAFDELAFAVQIDDRGTVLRAAADRGPALVRRQGLALVDEPAARIPNERLAWLFPRSDAMPVPASDRGLWLMSVLPTGSGEPDRELSPRADRPGGRTDF